MTNARNVATLLNADGTVKTTKYTAGSGELAGMSDLILVDDTSIIGAGNYKTYTHAADTDMLRSIVAETFVAGLSSVSFANANILSSVGDIVLDTSHQLNNLSQSVSQVSMDSTGLVTTALSFDNGTTYGAFSTDHQNVSIPANSSVLKVKTKLQAAALTVSGYQASNSNPNIDTSTNQFEVSRNSAQVRLTTPLINSGKYYFELQFVSGSSPGGDIFVTASDSSSMGLLSNTNRWNYGLWKSSGAASHFGVKVDLDNNLLSLVIPGTDTLIADVSAINENTNTTTNSISIPDASIYIYFGQYGLGASGVPNRFTYIGSPAVYPAGFNQINGSGGATFTSLNLDVTSTAQWRIIQDANWTKSLTSTTETTLTNISGNALNTRTRIVKSVGAAGSSGAAPVRVEFTATAGQTTKTGLTYTVGNIDCYVNGSKMMLGTDFTAGDGVSVTFSVALTLGAEVQLIMGTSASVASGAGTTTSTSYDYTKTIGVNAVENLLLPVPHNDNAVVHLKQFVDDGNVTNAKWDFDTTDESQWTGGSFATGLISSLVTGSFVQSSSLSGNTLTTINEGGSWWSTTNDGDVVMGSGGGWMSGDVGLEAYNSSGTILVSFSNTEYNSASVGKMTEWYIKYRNSVNDVWTLLETVTNASSAETHTVNAGYISAKYWRIVGRSAHTTYISAGSGQVGFNVQPLFQNTLYSALTVIESLASISTAQATSIGSISVIESKPVNTNVVYALSFDDKVTYTADMDSTALSAFDFSTITLGDSLDIKLTMSSSPSGEHTAYVDQISVNMQMSGSWAHTVPDPDRLYVIESGTNTVVIENKTNVEKTLKIRIEV